MKENQRSDSKFEVRKGCSAPALLSIFDVEKKQSPFKFSRLIITIGADKKDLDKKSQIRTCLRLINYYLQTSVLDRTERRHR